MKSKFLFIAFVSLFGALSCILEIENARKREDVIGVWEVTPKSLKEQKEDKIYSFQLNEDSTALICRNNTSQAKSKGTWLWDVEKHVGNRKLGISFRYDVRLDIKNAHHRLGFLLDERNGDLYLSVNEYEFKKID